MCDRICKSDELTLVSVYQAETLNINYSYNHNQMLFGIEFYQCILMIN